MAAAKIIGNWTLRVLAAGLCALVFSVAARAERIAFLVPSQIIYPGQTIGNAGLTEKYFTIRASAAAQYVLTPDQLVGKVSRRTLLPGQPILLSSVNEPDMVQRGVPAVLVMTPLAGADGQVYAAAQGNLIVSGFTASGNAATLTQGVPTSGRIPNGALVEKEVSGNFGQEGELLVELRQPDFTTVVRITDTINAFAKRRYNQPVAKERDAKSIRLRKPKDMTAARFLAEIEGLPVPTDEVARVVVDERTGTVVIGEKVRISRVAISHGTLSVKVTETPTIIQPEPFSDGVTAVEPNTNIQVQQTSKIGVLGGTDLESLVKGLNQIGVKPQGIIAILQGIKTAGALHAELVVQ